MRGTLSHCWTHRAWTWASPARGRRSGTAFVFRSVVAAFKGDKPLAFGVQLHELTFHTDQNRVRLRTTGLVAVRRSGAAAAPIARPVLLAGLEDDVFVSL